VRAYSPSRHDSTEVNITICKADLDRIKSRPHLALRPNSTFMTVSISTPLAYSISTRPIDYYVQVHIHLTTSS
jgi:hypothetical protein